MRGWSAQVRSEASPVFEPPFCPNPKCAAHTAPGPAFFVRRGSFKTKSRRQAVPRFDCRLCGKSFSRQTFRADYRDHRPDLNARVLEHLARGSGLRKAARALGISRTALDAKARKIMRQLRELHDDASRRFRTPVGTASGEPALVAREHGAAHAAAEQRESATNGHRRAFPMGTARDRAARVPAGGTMGACASSGRRRVLGAVESAGMSLINWIFDAYQHHKIGRAQQETADLRRELASLRDRNDGEIDTARLVRAIGELALALKTVQQIVVEKGLCTEAEFRARLREIDVADGVEDGRSPI